MSAPEQAVSNLQRIFVYGTLKRGLSNAHYLNGQTFVGTARTLPQYRMVNAGGYPGLYEVPEEEGGLRVRGEVWEVDAACRKELDLLEDVAVGLYELVPVALEEPFASGQIFTYLYRWSIMGRDDAGDDWRES